MYFLKVYSDSRYWKWNRREQRQVKVSSGQVRAGWGMEILLDWLKEILPQTTQEDLRLSVRPSVCLSTPRQSGDDEDKRSSLQRSKHHHMLTDRTLKSVYAAALVERERGDYIATTLSVTASSPKDSWRELLTAVTQHRRQRSHERQDHDTNMSISSSPFTINHQAACRHKILQF